ncbi:MAG: 3-isopropylmalate dehydrogenase, partial [Proteobacteria bacterium]
MTSRIVLLPGDGIGPEVTEAAQRVLVEVASRCDLSLSLSTELIGGVAIDETGQPLPDATVEACLTADAVLLGA